MLGAKQTTPPREEGSNNNNDGDISISDVSNKDVSATDVCTTDSTDNFKITFFDKQVKVNVKKKLERTVINLSSYNLMETDINVLRKGLKFCPTPGEPQMGQILDMSDVHEAK